MPTPSWGLKPHLQVHVQHPRSRREDAYPVMGIETECHSESQYAPIGVRMPTPSWGLKLVKYLVGRCWDLGVRMPTPSWGLKQAWSRRPGMV